MPLTQEKFDKVFKIGEWRLIGTQNRLESEHQTKILEPKQTAVLLALAEKCGEVVSSEELIQQVWGGAHVTETIVRRAISTLRKAMGDDARTPDYIETVTGAGYRLKLPAIQLFKSSINGKGEEEPPTEHRRLARPNASDLHRKPSWREQWLLVGTSMLAGAILMWAITYQAGCLITRQANKLAIESISATGDTITTKQSPYFSEYEDRGGRQSKVAFAPNGEMAAFVAWHEDQKKPSILIRNLDGGGRKRDKEIANADWPVWSRDGNRLAFVSQEADGNLIALVHPSTPSDLIEVYRSAHALQGLDWLAPDTLVFSEGDPGGTGYQLKTCTLGQEDGSTVLFRPPPGYLGDMHPRVAPDGRSLVFFRADHKERGDLFQFQLKEKTLRRLTFLETDIKGICWRPAQNTLVFSARMDGHFGLWQITEPGQAPAPLASGYRNTFYPFFQDKNTLAFEMGRIEGEIWGFQAGTAMGDIRSFVAAFQHDTMPAAAPSAADLALISHRSGTPELWIWSRKDSSLYPLTSMGGKGMRHPAWSEDGLHLAFDATLKDHSDIFLQPKAGGSARQLTFSPGEDRLASWSQDGQWIYFSSNRKDGWQIWRTTPQGGRAEQVTWQGGFKSQVFDRALFFGKYRNNEIWRLELGTGKEILVTELPENTHGNWSVTQAGLVFLTREDDRWVVQCMNLQSGEKKVWQTLESEPAPFSLAVTPDAGYVYWAQEQLRQSRIRVIPYH